MAEEQKPFVPRENAGNAKETLKRNSTMSDDESSSRCRWMPETELRCVLLMGVAFMLLFGAFDAQSFVIELSLRSIANSSETANIVPFDGYLGTSMVYFTFMLSVCFTPMIVARLGSKNSMTIGSLGFTAYLLAFQAFDRYVLFSTSAIVGVGAALMWTAQSAYMKEITTKGKAERNNGLNWAVLCCSLIIAGTSLLVVLHSADGASIISERLIRISYTVMAILSISANIVFFLLPHPPEVPSIPEKKISTVSNIQEFGSVFTLLREKTLYFQIVGFLFIGIESGLFQGVLPTSLLFTKRIEFASPGTLLACYAFACGAGQIGGMLFFSYKNFIVICAGGLLGGLLIGMISRRSDSLGRATAICLGFVCILSSFALIFISIPATANLGPTDEMSLIEPSLTLAFVTTMLLAFGDSSLKVVRGSVLTTAFRSEDTPKACALSRLFQSFGSCTMLYASSMITLHAHLAVLSILLVATTAGFVGVSIVERRRQKNEDDDKTAANKSKRMIFNRKITVNI